MLSITQEETLQPQTKPNLTQNCLEPKGKAANLKLSSDVQQLHSNVVALDPTMQPSEQLPYHAK
jgi:hypothetical protein